MGQLLGGDATPIGWSIQYIRAPTQDVLAAIRQARKDVKLRVGEPRPYPASLQALLPFGDRGHENSSWYAVAGRPT